IWHRRRDKRQARHGTMEQQTDGSMVVSPSEEIGEAARKMPATARPEAIVVLLRRMIVTGQLLPGTRISVQRLCRRFNVSRTPVREALKTLSGEGLVLLRPNRRAVVL